MNPLQLRSKWSMSLGSISIHARESFTSSVLPSKREVIERMIWFLVPKPSGSSFQTSREEAAQLVSQELCEHWIWCNVYPKKLANVSKIVSKLYDELKKLNSMPKARRTKTLIQDKVNPFLKSLEEGLDIRTIDLNFRKKQEEEHGVTETEDEDHFWKDQMEGKRVGYCDSFVDKKWICQMKRKKQDLESFFRREKRSIEEIETTLSKAKDIFLDPDEDTGKEDDFKEKQESDEEYADMDPEYEETKGSKKRKRMNLGDPENNQELPYNYRHIWTSVKKVRQEYYTAVDRQVSELHMSKEQAIGSTIIVAKELFGLKWKRFDEDEDKVDLDTVPDKKCIREVGKAREAMALSCLVEKIMMMEARSKVQDPFQCRESALTANSFHFPAYL